MIQIMRLVFTITASVTLLFCVWGSPVLAGEWQEEFNIAGRRLTHTGEFRYLILLPGFQTVLESRDERLTITVLDETMEINGILTRVVEERELQKGKLHEVSRNFVAIDAETGDVFCFGEDVNNYEKGKIVNHAGTWKAYEHGNRPGLIVPGNPSVGMKYYRELAPGIAMDQAEIVSVSETVKTPAGEFRSCLKVRESSRIKGGREYKIYAPGIGLVQKEAMRLIRHGYLKGRSAPK